MALYRHTEILRRTVDMTGRIIVGQDHDAPPRSWRVVCVIVPAEGAIELAIGPGLKEADPDRGEQRGIDDAGAFPDDIADIREGVWPEPNPGQDYLIRILPDQWIAARAVDGDSKVSVIIEYEAEDWIEDPGQEKAILKSKTEAAEREG